ncbi:hypothetical protein AJ87_49670, partial [Rhizobium yanglingense]
MRIIVFIASSINWLFVGIADADLVATLFGGDSALSTIIYILVGLSALWQLVPFGPSRSGK